jgi:hypothetical protein
VSNAQIHRGLTYDEYSVLPGWRWSVIKAMAESPLHCLHAKRTSSPDTASRVLLRAVHALTLEPHRFAESFSVYEGKRDARTAAYQQHLADNPDTAVLTPKDFALAKSTADAIRHHPIAGPLFAEGEPEVSITWLDHETGLPCKARLDWLAPRFFFDLKNLGTTNERMVARHVAAMLIHGQVAHYTAALEAVGIRDLPAYLLVTEGKGPQDVAVFEVDAGIPDGALHVGAELRRDLMKRLSDCVQDDRWPGRHEKPVNLCLPNYALLDPDLVGIEGGNEAEELIP